MVFCNQAQVPGSYKANPFPTLNKKSEVPSDFFSKCIKKGWLKTLPKKQVRISCFLALSRTNPLDILFRDDVRTEFPDR
jgi:hypothetical protein